VRGLRSPAEGRASTRRPCGVRRSCRRFYAVSAATTSQPTPVKGLTGSERIRDAYERLSSAGFGEQTKNFQIQPDERDHQTERAVPLHVLGDAHAYAALDHVEVQHQIQRGHDHHEQTERNAPRAAAVEDPDGNMK